MTITAEDQTLRCLALSHTPSNIYSSWSLACVRLYHTPNDFLELLPVLMCFVDQFE